MSEQQETKPEVKSEAKPENKTSQAGTPSAGTSLYARKVGARTRGGRGQKKEEKKDDFEQKIIDLARVTRVMAGGKRMRFRACICLGDKKGQVGIGIAKGADVTNAVNKAANQARKKLITLPLDKNSSIKHEVSQKFGAAKILFRPSKAGHGVIAGGVVRIVLELAGVKNISSKILGSNNKVNNAKCTIEALKVFEEK